MACEKASGIQYYAAMCACEKASGWTYALDLLSSMRREGVEPNTTNYVAAISACEIASALDSLSSMLLACARKPLDAWMQGVEPNTINYFAAVSACTNALEWTYALDLLSSMRHEVVEFVAWHAARSLEVSYL